MVKEIENVFEAIDIDPMRMWYTYLNMDEFMDVMKQLQPSIQKIKDFMSGETHKEFLRLMGEEKLSIKGLGDLREENEVLLNMIADLFNGWNEKRKKYEPIVKERIKKRKLKH